MSFKNKVVIISGGSGGIGKKLAEILANDKAQISICDVDQTNGEEFVTKLNKENGVGSAIFTKCDVSNRASFREVFRKTKAHFGKIDIVVNNAGFFDDSETRWESSVDVNVKGLISGSLLGIEFMGTEKGGEGGIVINLCSVVALHPVPQLPIYSATKAAAFMFTRNMANELHYSKNKVKFIAICPHGSLGSNFFESLSGKFLYPDNYLEESFKAAFDIDGFQSIDHVSQAIAKITKVGNNGSIWLIENSEEEKEINVVDYKIYGV